jgi:hypothetical protein
MKKQGQYYPNGPFVGWQATNPSVFMLPTLEYFDEQEALECVGSEFDEDVELRPRAGWYARLSAPGYLDATGWQGPYDTFYRALRDLCRTYNIKPDGSDNTYC